MGLWGHNPIVNQGRLLCIYCIHKEIYFKELAPSVTEVKKVPNSVVGNLQDQRSLWSNSNPSLKA